METKKKRGAKKLKAAEVVTPPATTRRSVDERLKRIYEQNFEDFDVDELTIPLAGEEKALQDKMIAVITKNGTQTLDAKNFGRVSPEHTAKWRMHHRGKDRPEAVLTDGTDSAGGKKEDVDDTICDELIEALESAMILPVGKRCTKKLENYFKTVEEINRKEFIACQRFCLLRNFVTGPLC